MSVTHIDVDVRMVSIEGGAAGDHAVEGITTRDVLKSVMYFSLDTSDVPDNPDTSLTIATLTDEFKITANGTINNTGGTSTTGGYLVVFYISAGPYGGDLNRN